MKRSYSSTTRKILFSATVYNHIVIFHIPLIKMMMSYGYEIWVAANHMPDHPKDKEILQQQGVKCVDISFSRSPISWKNIQAVYQLRKLLSEVYFDILHFHTPVAAFLGRFMASQVEQGYVIYTVHGYHFFKGAPLLNWILFYPCERLCVRWTDLMIVTNKEDYNQAIKLGFKADKNLYHVNGVGVDIELFNHNDTDSSDRVTKECGQKFIGYIGEINKNKNHIFLLKNWKSIVHANPNTHLLIIGTGDYQENLKKYIEKNGLKNITFLGYRNDIEALLNKIDIVCLLSKREGLPKSILEAMSAAKPCIVTNIRGMRDLVNDQENGFLIDLDDDDGLINAFSILLQDSHKMNQFAIKSSVLVKKFSLDKVLKNMASIYMNSIE